jgi:hypothetical protein
MSEVNFQKVLVSGPVINDDGSRSVVVSYQTDDATTTGLGLAVSFDSASLALTGSTLLNSTDNIAAGNESVDGDTQTITFAWASLFGSWPGSAESDLFELTFEPVDGGGTNYDIEFATTSVAAGFTAVLPGPTAILTSPLAVTLNTIDENSGEGQVVASVDGGPSDAIYTLVDNTDYGDQADQPDQAQTVINVPAPAASTQQVYVSSSTTSEDGTQETVVISYNSDSAATTGLGLDIHFDSSKVSASDITALVGTDLLVNGSIKSDDSDLDGDASTDQIVSFGWASLFGNWPGSESADLATITFDIAEGAEGAFDLNFTASSTAAGYTFVGQNQEIAIQTVVQPPLTIDSATGDVTLNVNPDFESVEDYDFTVVANAGTDSEEQVPVLLSIGNLDEVAPTVTSSNTAPAVNENVDSVVIYTATADDSADTSDGVEFSLGAGSDSALSIDENTGEVYLDVSVDFELQEEISFSVIATDLAGNVSTEQSVTVNVANLDEVAPTITSGPITAMIDENSGAGQVIYTATADDSMDISNGVTFGLSDNANGKVSIDPASGDVTFIGNPDYENDSTVSFSVFATDAAGNQSISTPVSLDLNNLDDSAPIFMDGAEVSLTEGNGGIEETHSNDESSYMSQVVWTADAYEDSSDIQSGIIGFSISDDHGGIFSIDYMTGDVSLDVAPDYEDETLGLNEDADGKYFSFTVTVEDSAGNSADQSVKLYVSDVAELPPVFSSVSEVNIDENNAGNDSIYLASATAHPLVVAGGASESVVYSLDENDIMDFSIDSSTGEVTFISQADHEMQPSYSFTVVATDELGNVNQLPVTLTVNDLDEVEPFITSGDTADAIDENEDAGQVIYTATADDSMDISNGVTFSLSDDSDPALTIDAATGEVTLADSPDHESQSVYSFSVIATDAAGNVSSEQSVSLDVNDLDDTAATITSSDTADAIDENTGVGQVIYTATADDSADVSDGISFSLAAGSDAALSIDADSGDVVLSADPDADTQSEYEFTVVVTDAAGNVTEQAVSLDINNLDEIAPTITSADTADAIDENSGAGQVIYTASADDSADVSGGVTFSLAAGSDAALSIDVNSGAVSLSTDPDHEAQSQYSFTVVATDEAGHSSEQTVTLDINDLDDTAPVITSPTTASVLESKGAGVSVYQAIVDDSADVNDGTLAYSLTGDDAGAFGISASGLVTLLEDPEADTQAEYSFTVVATDGAGNASQQTVTLTVVDQDLEAPEFTSAVSVSIDENSGADQAVYTATVQESSPYSFALSDSSDSALTIDASTGVVTLAGDPNAEAQAQYDFTVVATDEAGNSSEHPVTLTINDLDEIAPTITSSSLASIDETGLTGELIYAASSHDSQSVIQQGAFSQQFVRNVDGTLTVRLFVDSSVADNYSSGLEAANFTLGYSSEEQGSLSVETVSFPSDPLNEIHNVQDGQISFAMYFTTPEFAAVATDGSEANLYDAAGAVAIAEVTFNVGNDSVVNQFTVSDAALTIHNGGTSFPGGQSVSEYQMTDADSSVVYSLANASDTNLKIDSVSGDVVLNAALDHESVDEYSFTVVATDLEGNVDFKDVVVAVNNLDEVAPVVTSGGIGASVDENSGAGQVIYTATASDNADTSNGVSFSLAAGSDSALTIDASTGEVTLADSPDHEVQDEYSFTVIATDAAGQSSDLAVTVSVNDLDEAAPNISSSADAGSVDENSGAQIVYTAEAEDTGDVTGGFTWSLSGADQDSFAINASTGDVTMLASPDYESQSEYNFTVVATDAAGNASEQTVSLSVNNLDEVSAVITSGDTAQEIAENSGEGQVIYTATADDSADVSGGVTFSLAEGSDAALWIDSSTGAVSLVNNPNFEGQSVYNFTVVATDAASNQASQSVSLSISNLDESAPTITSGDDVSIVENTGVNQVVYTATSTDSDDVSGGVTYSLAEGSDVALSIDADSGAVTLAKNPDYESQEKFDFTVVATDVAGNVSESKDVKVSIVDKMIHTVTHWSSDVVLGAEMVDGTPHKELSEAEITQSITAGDALDALKLSVGLSVDSYQESDNAEMFQQLSADVNQDGKISSADALGLLLSAAKVDGAFESEWKFVEMHQDHDSASFAGYVLGDVDGSWASAHDAPVINLEESAVANQVIYNFDATSSTVIAQGGGLNVDLAAGEVSLAEDANYEHQSSYSFTLINQFSGKEQSFTVSVLNEDEVAPEIVSSTTVSLAENSGAGQVVYVAVADDSDDFSGGLTYSLADGSDSALSIDPITGDVTLVDNPDYSVASGYSFTVVATDSAGHYDTQAVTINVEPTPDSVAPEFVSGESATAVDENSGAAQVIYTALASDENDVTYSLSGDASGLTIDAVSGEVALLENPDYEARSDYSFTVVATDEAGNSSEQAVSLTINNLDDTAAVISSGDTSDAIDENSGTGQVVYTATADDSADVSDGVTFSLAAGSDSALSIDSNTGAVTLNADPDYEAQSEYSFSVIATDAAGNVSQAQSVTLDINNLDDKAAVITSGDTADAIDENSGAGQVIYTATADDSADVSDGVTFSLAAGSDSALSINANTGRVMLSNNPDFESADSYDFVVVATDAAGNSSEQSVSLTINNMDETAPSISSEAAVSIDENSGAGQAVYTAVASDDADISAGVTFSLSDTSDSALEIDADTGVVTLAENPDQEAQSEYNFTVIASDGVNQSTQAVTLTVNDLDEYGPIITSSDSASLDENMGSDQVVYTATADDSFDFSEGFTFSLADGSDAALSIDATTGAVTLAENPDADTQDTYSFTVIATDAAGNESAGQPVTLSINDLDEVAATVTSSDSADAIDENSGAGQVVYTATADDSGDVSGGFTFSLAAGSNSALSIDAQTGAVTLSDDPNFEAQDEYSFTVVVTDAAGNVSEGQSVSLSINNLDEVAATVTSSDSAGAIDENSGAGQVVYTATADDSGDVSGGFTFSLAAGSDDALSIDAQTGAVTLSDDPNFEAQDEYSFTVVVTDAAGNESEGQSVSLSINNLDEVAATIISSGSAGSVDENSGANTVIYTAVANDSSDISGGVTYSLAAGSDSALSIDGATGEVTLAKDTDFEAQSSFSFIVIATDAAGNVSLGKPVTLAVNNLDEVSPAITSGDSANNLDENSGAGQWVYTATADDSADVSNGVAFSLADGSDGFSIDAASGVVTTNADFVADAESSAEQNFTVVATDAAGNSSEQAVSLTINDLDEVAPEITSGDAADAIYENSGSGQVIYTASASDDDDVSAGYSFKLSSDSDSALSVDSETGAVTLNTNPDYEAKSQYSFTVIATDAAGNESAGESVTLDINNLDEVAPEITSGDSAGIIAENSGAGQVIYTASSDDSGDTSDAVTYSLSEHSDSALSIDANTGEVTLADDPNFEAQSAYSFIVIATDSAGNSSSELVSLNVSNLDEAAPTITSGETASSVDENSGEGQLVYTATADDSADVSVGVSFSLADSDVGFSIDSVTGAVTTNADFVADYEDASEQSFTVIATDAAGYSSQQTVTVAVNNLDESSPEVTSADSASAIDENSGAGQVIYTATATDDADTSDGFSFSLADGSDSAVSIDAETGVVTLADNPDFEGQAEYSFTVVASDAAGNASAGQVVTVAINNLDEVAPTITLYGVASDLDENSGANQVLATISADDSADISGGVTYSLSADSDPALSINNETGEVILSDNPDFEVKSEYSMTVVATDAAGNISDAQTISLVVNNVDESAPTITSTDSVIVVEGTGAGQVVYQAAADDSGDVSDGVSYTLAEDVTVNSEGSSELAANTQVVSVSDVTKSGDQLSVSVEYNADDADLTGLGLQIHFDSSELTLADISDVLAQDHMFTDAVVQTDTDDLDDNASTDSFVHVAWASVDGDWTGEVPTDLLTMNFTVADTATGSTSIGFSASDNAIGYDFVGNSASIGFDSSDLTIDSGTGEVTLSVDPSHAVQSAYDFTVVATDAAGLTDEQQVTLNVAEVVAGAAASATESGAIEQRFVQNSDGSITLQLFVSAATAVNYANGIENFDLVLNYDSSQVGSIVANQISAPANPFISLANDTVDGEVAVAQIYFPNPYSVSSGTPIMEVDFNLLDGVSSATFGVSGVIIGMDDAESSSYDVSVTTYAGTDDADIFALVDGVADVNSGAGSDIFVVTEDTDTNILVDFESGIDTLELGMLLGSAGYTGLSANSNAADQSAHQMNGNIPNLADLISDNDDSLDNAFGGYLDDSTNVLTIFTDVDSSAGSVDMQSIEVTLGDDSTVEDEDLTATFSAFIA